MRLHLRRKSIDLATPTAKIRRERVFLAVWFNVIAEVTLVVEMPLATALIIRQCRFPLGVEATTFKSASGSAMPVIIGEVS
jgi:p-aminobenzoyl-glutamate transporter AbgT